MTRKPEQDEAMKNRSVRLSDAEWAALERIGTNLKPLKAGPATVARLAVQEYIKRNEKGGK
jgi:hypothetical protein